MRDNLEHLHRRAAHRRQQNTDPVFPGGGSGPKFPAESSTPNQQPTQPTQPQQPSSVAQQPSSAPAPSSAAPVASAPQSSAAPVSSAAPSTSSTPSSSSTPTPPSTSSTPSSTIPTTSAAPTSAPAVVAAPSVVNPATTVVFASATPTLGSGAAASLTSASASPSATPSGGVSTGVIIGGVAAGAVAIIGILFGIFYFMRKRGSDEDDVLGNWDADAARRQSRMLDEPEPMPPSMNMYGGGGSLRPPTMIERHVNNASPMLARQRSLAQQQYGQPQQPAYDHNGYPIDNGYPVANGYGAPVNYGPGPSEYMHNMPPPPAGNPFMSPYEQSMPSPVSSHVPQYDSHVVPEPAMPQSAVTRQPSQLSRQHSLSGGPEGDSYADLSRTSVTPYQAQQYAEISNKLNSPVLGAVAEEYPASPPPALTPGAVSPTHMSPSQPIPRSNPPAGGEHKRPDTMYSAIYDEEDAYGGI